MIVERAGCVYRYYKDRMSYIGQTVNIKKRKNVHKRAKDDTFFHASIRKNGIDAFGFEILEDNIPESELDEREVYWVSHFNSVSPNGYNLKSGGSRPFYSEESRKKMSESNKGKNKGKPSWSEGKKLLPETCAKISKANTGKKHSPEHREKISKAMMGKRNGKDNPLYGKPAWNRGKKHSPESRRKMSESHKGKPSPETCAKISKANTGKKHTFESRRKMSESHKGKKHTFESRRKMSESHKGKPSPRKGKKFPIDQNKEEVLRRRTQRLIKKGWSIRKVSSHLGIGEKRARRLRDKTSFTEIDVTGGEKR